MLGGNLLKRKGFFIISGIIFSTFLLFVDVTPSNSDSICSNVTDVGILSEGLDLVFIPVGFDDMSEFDSLVMEHIDPDSSYKGLLYYEPFKGSWSKFNFLKTERLPAEIEDNFMERHCQYADSPYIWQCIQDVKGWLSENNCVYDKAIIIFNNLPPNTGGGWAESLNGAIALTVARVYPPFENQGHMETVHELGHMLGLTDEMVGGFEFNGYGYSLEALPNCDVAGCPKWCQDYVRNPSGEVYELCKNLSKSNCQNNVNCFWRNRVDEFYKTQCVPLADEINIGLNCLEGTGCYYNCNGVGAWRPATYTSEGQPTSMMFYMMNALGFDSVDKRHLELGLNGYSEETVSPPSIPSGQISGRTGIDYSYSTGGSISNFDHPVEYQFDWKGDETDLSPWGSATQSKIWSTPGTFHVRAKARCSVHTSIESDWSGSFTVSISSPEGIVLQLPLDGAVFDSSDLISAHQPSFSWTESETVTRCTVLFSTSSTGFSPPIARASVSGTKDSWTPPIFLWKKLMSASNNNGAIQDIYWKVIGALRNRSQLESNVWRFRIDLPRFVAINSPLDDAILPPDVPPTFAWQTNGNVKFKLEISALADFSHSTKIKSFNCAIKDPNVETTLNKMLPSFQWNAVKKLIGAEQGHFRIKAWDGINRETVSEIRTFRIQ
jgi:hypothetical protein